MTTAHTLRIQAPGAAKVDLVLASQMKRGASPAQVCLGKEAQLQGLQPGPLPSWKSSWELPCSGIRHRLKSWTGDVMGHAWLGKAWADCRTQPLNSVCIFIHVCVYGGRWSNRSVTAVRSFITGQCQVSCKSLSCWCYLDIRLCPVSVSPTDCYWKFSLKTQISNMVFTLVENNLFPRSQHWFLLVPIDQKP